MSSTKGILTNIFQVPKMSVQATLHIADSRTNENSWYSVYNKNGKEYITLYPNANLKIKYLKNKSYDGISDWSQQDQIYLTNRTIGGFKLDLRSFYEKFQRPDLFLYNEDNVPISINKGERNIVLLCIGRGQMCRLEPAIITEPNSKPVPGVIMRINVKAHEVAMTISEFESFYDIMQNIQLHELGFQMIQLYLLMRNPAMEQSTPKRTSQIQLFEIDDDPEKDMTTDTPVIKNSKTLDDL